MCVNFLPQVGGRGGGAGGGGAGGNCCDMPESNKNSTLVVKTTRCLYKSV